MRTANPTPITFGRRQHSARVADLTVTETRHGAGLRIGSHAHEVANLYVTLSGRLRETVERAHLDGEPGTMLVKPGGARHSNEYGGQAVVGLVIEVPEPAQDRLANGGGLFPAAMIEHLRRIPLAAYSQRHGSNVRVPGQAVLGPKVLLTNNYAGSGGDAFAIYFRAAGLGPIIGGRTEGATIGNVSMPLLIDNGEIAVPALAFEPPAGGAAVENAGVVPDLEIEPALVEPSTEPDPQLAAAIASVLQQLERRH